MYTQRANGQFTVEVEGDYHCGPNHDTPKTFAFEVELTYCDECLDERGFLLDNLTFQRYFDSIQVTDLSCERLVRKCAEYFCKLAGERFFRCVVAIWAIPNAAKIVFEVENKVKGATV